MNSISAIPIRRALLSVSDKTGIVDFARALADLGVEILSTGGTANLLSANDISVIEVADYTGCLLYTSRYLAALGAELVLTPKEKGMPGAIEKAQELLQEMPSAWMPQQFENPANVQIHRSTTAQEILADFPEGLDYLICLLYTSRCV